MATKAGRDTDVLIIGAGMAGLVCALDLVEAGFAVQVLEAGDAPGGRMRTDAHDGFLLDRGFQVFNTGYPQVRRRIDTAALDLRPFTPGFLLDQPGGRVPVANPLRAPRVAARLRPGALGSARDLAAFAAFSARYALTPPRTIKRGPDLPARQVLAKAGMSARFIDEVLRPFFAGVFLEDGLDTSGHMFQLVWRSMMLGRIALPATGIGAVPAQLARRLPAGVLRLESPVKALTDDGVVLADGGELAARTVVVATDGPDAAALLPQLPVPQMRAVTTYYHATPYPPLDEPILVVDSTMRVLNTVVISNVCPGYAPVGLALVSTSVLAAESAPDEADVRRDLAEIYRTDTANWRLVKEYRINRALPAMPAPWPLSRTTRVAPGRYACGDHRATGSVQGAMASGARAAREVRADLGRGGPFSAGVTVTKLLTADLPVESLREPGGEEI
ncbi:MAG TPA: NAD(P)/FAD-dependent oxidoreductase [Actinocrinis sp.]|nr:NAD(P)/FAD-dependent oxidoreductase [Actinocrinis sp.]